MNNTDKKQKIMNDSMKKEWGLRRNMKLFHIFEDNIFCLNTATSDQLLLPFPNIVQQISYLVLLSQLTKAIEY